VGKGGEMTQMLHAHMNKRENNNKKKEAVISGAQKNK
jgi:hypothetical protein